MPTAIKCLFNGRTIDVTYAIELRGRTSANAGKSLEFKCVECRRPVRPHQTGGHVVAHFEHLARNEKCSLSHRAKNGTRRLKLMPEFEIDDVRAIEGYKHDHLITSHSRNRRIVQSRKRMDDYTCRACGFQLAIGGKHVIECHHTKPISAMGVHDVSIAELICLCPTCHRIAHLRSRPFSVDEIRYLLRKRTK